MEEIAGLCTRGVLALGAPSDLANAGQQVRDGLLLAVMMAGTRSRV
jgi:hypothetical protein